MRILLVEDDQPLREAIAAVLREEAYQVDDAEDGEDGLLLARQDIYDLLILDIMLPGISGTELLKRLRQQRIAAPVMFLTAKDSVEDRVAGLDLGADDYLVKPFATQELLARVRVLLRRRGGVGQDGDLTYGLLTLRPKAYDGYVNNRPLKLTNKEFKLLEFLMLNREQILTRDQIFDRVWGFDADSSSSVVDVYMHYLRKKLAEHACDSLVQTVRGVGYMLKEPS